jgi:hypothetical protein
LRLAEERKISTLKPKRKKGSYTERERGERERGERGGRAFRMSSVC